jgi:hypothetical protein
MFTFSFPRKVFLKFVRNHCSPLQHECLAHANIPQCDDVLALSVKHNLVSQIALGEVAEASA